MSGPVLLAVEGLEVAFPGATGWVPVVRGISFQVEAGEMVGLVGESGSGKTLTALALLGLVPPPGRVCSGRILYQGRDLATLSDRERRKLRGGKVGMVFQEPTAALDPVFSVGYQIGEAVRAHHRLSRRQAEREAIELLGQVGIASPRQRLADYPHQLSGGQRQRMLIALALAGRPSLLIADEPTSALDATLQVQILDLLARLGGELGLAVLLITHDLAAAASTCRRALVMYCGQVVEEAPLPDLVQAPRHPYTRSLVAAVPRLGQPSPRGQMPVTPGQAPDADALPPGCSFEPRCERAMAACSEAPPASVEIGPRSRVRCLLYTDQGSPEERRRGEEPATSAPAEGTADGGASS